MQILFYDTSSFYGYSLSTLKEHAIGGTEATVIRIAHGLSCKHTVFVAQALRSKKEEVDEHGVHYISMEAAHTLTPDVVILLRDHLKLQSVGEQYPKAKKFLWVHNFPPKNLFYSNSDLIKHGYQIIAVSNFLRELIKKRLRGKWYQRFCSNQKSVGVRTIYNPIDDDLSPDNTPWDPDKLLFLSAPYKGLGEVIVQFQRVRKKFPELKLYIGIPGHGHRNISDKLLKDVEFLGELPHHEIIQHLRESFCVFYPQYEKAETFGLIFAEANAVGTPVLAHDFGAASEVLNNSEQLVNGRKTNQVIEKIAEWRKQRPMVSGRSEFKLSHVLERWSEVLQKQPSIAGSFLGPNQSRAR